MLDEKRKPIIIFLTFAGRLATTPNHRKTMVFEKGNRAENAYIIYTLAYTLKGNRFIQTYGVIKDELKKIKDDNEVTDIIEQVFDYKWNFVTHKYEKVGNNEK